MSNKLFERTKLNLERTIQDLLTNKSEFIYADTKSTVPVNKTYSVYYVNDKSKLYFTNLITSKYVRSLIRIKGFDIYDQYTTIKPTESDYRIGTITRYFAQIGNDTSKPIFEVYKDDYNIGNLYRYTSFQWRLSGLKEEVMRDNQVTIDGLEKEYTGINKVLFPLQFWRAPKNSADDVENKLLLMKKT